MVRALPLQPVDRHLRLLGNIIIQLWEVRDALSRAHPEVGRSAAMDECETDEQRFLALDDLHAEALAAESAGAMSQAAALFERLLTEASFGHFKLCAEAGLYRTRRQDAA